MPETLQSVRKAATTWRKTRRRGAKGGRLPNTLKQRAIGLLDHHSPAEIARAVGVSDTRLVERWRNRFGPSRSSVVPPGALPGFVELLAPDGVMPARRELQPHEVEMELGGGEYRLRLRGRLDVTLVRALAELVVCGREVHP